MMDEIEIFYVSNGAKMQPRQTLKRFIFSSFWIFHSELNYSFTLYF